MLGLRSNLCMSVTTHAAAFMTRCSLSVVVFGVPVGATENAGHENVAQSKMQGWKMRDMENATQKCSGEQITREKFVWKTITT